MKKWVRGVCFGLVSILFTMAVPVNALANASGNQQPSSNITVTVGSTTDLNDRIVRRSNEENNEWYFVGTMQWNTSDSNIVSVTENGVITAHRVGVATITASNWDNLAEQHTKKIVVGVTAGNTSSSGDSFEIGEGKLIDLGVLFFPGNSSTAIAASWSSTNSSIVSVDQNGLVDARSIGNATVTATYSLADGAEVSRSAKVRVTALLSDRSKSITINLSQGESVDMVDLFYPNYKNIRSDISIRSSDTGIIAVSGKGITTKGSGSCIVTLAYNNGDDEVPTQKFTVYVT